MIQSLSNASALGANGAAADFGIVEPFSLVASPVPGTSPMPRAYPCGVATAGTGVTAGAVQLQGSLDGVTWYAIGAPVTFSAPGTSPLPSASPPVPARYVRASVSTAFVGGTVSAWVDAAP